MLPQCPDLWQLVSSPAAATRRREPWHPRQPAWGIASRARARRRRPGTRGASWCRDRQRRAQGRLAGRWPRHIPGRCQSRGLAGQGQQQRQWMLVQRGGDRGSYGGQMWHAFWLYVGGHGWIGRDGDIIGLLWIIMDYYCRGCLTCCVVSDCHLWAWLSGAKREGTTGVLSVRLPLSPSP